MDTDRGTPVDAEGFELATLAARYKRTVLATCCIPWRDAGRELADEDLFSASIESLVERGFTDLYIFGTAGEGHNVDDQTFRRITELFVSEVRRLKATPMVGVISTSLSTMLDRIEFAAGIGCRVFQFAYAGWGSLNDKELFSLFRAVCGRYPELEFIHYNLWRSGRVVLPREYAKLAGENPNLVGTKYGAGNPEIVTGLVTQAAVLQHFFTELGFYYGSAVGECSLLASISSTNPRAARSYFQAGVDRDLPTLTDLYSELAEMMVSLRTAVGNGPHSDAAYDKVISKVNDSRFPLDLLPPYQGASEEAYQNYREDLVAQHARWIEESQLRIAPLEAEPTDLSYRAKTPEV